MSDSAPEASTRAFWISRLGWRHHGFRAASRPHALLGLGLILALPCILDLTAALVVGLEDRYLDFRIWYEAAGDWMTDPSQPLYKQHGGYLYPPFFITVFAPLSALPPAPAVAIFQALKWVAVYISMLTAWRLCSPRGEDLPPLVALASIVFTWRFIDNEIPNGNINQFIVCGVLGACWLAARGRQMSAGFLVTLLACVKITPALVLVYFVYKRWWRTLPGAAVALVFGLLLWPALRVGWDNNWQALLDWHEHLMAGFLQEGNVLSAHTNQTLTALLNRLLGPEKALEPDIHVALVILPKWALTLLRGGLSAGILLALAWVCRGRVWPQQQPLAFAAEVALIQVAMLALSGYSWKAHFVAMLLPYAVLMAFLADARYPAPRRRTLGGLVAISFVLCSLTGDILTPTGADYAEAFGLILAGALVAAGGLWIVRGQLRRQVPVDVPQAGVA
ncbi:MAG: DUF2029 domain-containing protein [Planctomycetes bacterium]|nr:DUF2029 domain-containing protein [Planctomycetota bacterium]